MKIGGKEIILTGSIGIAVYDGTQLSHEDLVNEAELAMYRAKRSGMDRIEIFKPTMRGERDNRLALESDLRRAIERRQISVLYQPITKLKGEDLAGFEALIRWDHPKHGRLSPDEFIPIAEESDLIAELGSYVLNQAVKDAVQWNRILVRESDPLVVSVNISSRELFRQELYQEVRMILAKEHLPDNALRLEVTETLVMENPELAVEILSWLRNAGASLALDDFGTGYSSLSYLHRFPFDTLKVDRSIVHNVALGKTGPAILRSVVTLGHELDMDVVAEGVESEEDMVFLRSVGCECAQGFYFGEPMTQKDVVYLLEALSANVKAQNKGGLFGLIRSLTGADGRSPDKGDVGETVAGGADPLFSGQVPSSDQQQAQVRAEQGALPQHNGVNGQAEGAGQYGVPVGGGGQQVQKRSFVPKKGAEVVNGQVNEKPGFVAQGEAGGRVPPAGVEVSQPPVNTGRQGEVVGKRVDAQGVVPQAAAERPVSGVEKQALGLTEALSMVERAAVTGQVVETGAADLKSTVDQKLGAMKSSLPGEDVYQQLARGGSYSDVSNLEGAALEENGGQRPAERARKFTGDAARLKGAPGPGVVDPVAAGQPQGGGLPPVANGKPMAKAKKKARKSPKAGPKKGPTSRAKR